MRSLDQFIVVCLIQFVDFSATYLVYISEFDHGSEDIKSFVHEPGKNIEVCDWCRRLDLEFEDEGVDVEF